MNKLIEALQIFLKYKNQKFPISCAHDILYVVDITEEEISPEDRKKLAELDFLYDDEEECWFQYT